ncbi:NUDIX domain-containing protein [Corallococcus sp. bb12-1]|uniref:NUDIX hydrolase n=1 Tax=Corallococcus sp. bb12-1 TaxID=2996784 RepID=UPI00226E95BF|nr:NUDIX domain-containing protein [Corallococcus sp. bb12-1]MCY1042105.1 NUDIX domain-containing protein [Corallococcus sp. bb12-1]
MSQGSPRMELIDVIDLSGRVIGTAPRERIYREKLPHRIVHVMLERDGTVFLQRRSQHVTYLPGHLCTSAGGHVDAGEAPLDAALRELEEELGVPGPLEPVAEFVFDDGHHRRIFLYRSRSEAPLRFAEREVDGGLFRETARLESLREEPCHPQLWPCLERLYPEALGAGRPVSGSTKA